MILILVLAPPTIGAPGALAPTCPPLATPLISQYV